MTYKQAQKTFGIHGHSTVLNWFRKHGTLDWKISIKQTMPKANETPAQKIKRLEKQLQDEKLKTSMLNYMLDLTDREMGTSIRKKHLSEQFENIKNELRTIIKQSINTYNEKRPPLRPNMKTLNFIYQRTLTDIGQGSSKINH